MSLLLLATYATLLALALAAYFRMERRHMEPAASEPNPAHVANEAAYGAMSKESLR